MNPSNQQWILVWKGSGIAFRSVHSKQRSARETDNRVSEMAHFVVITQFSDIGTRHRSNRILILACLGGLCRFLFAVNVC